MLIQYTKFDRYSLADEPKSAKVTISDFIRMNLRKDEDRETIEDRIDGAVDLSTSLIEFLISKGLMTLDELEAILPRQNYCKIVGIVGVALMLEGQYLDEASDHFNTD